MATLSRSIGLSREQRITELGRDLLSAAYLRGSFVLRSGRTSNYYFDKYLFETKPSILRRLAAFMAELVPPGTDRIAGPELGAVRVLLVEDVVTTGSQAIEAGIALRAAGATVSNVLVVIDREEGAQQFLAAAGYQLRALFRRSDLGI